MTIKRLLDKIWFSIRNQVVSRRHLRVAKVWRIFINEYFNGRIEKNNLRAKKNITGKIIWQYWGQEDDDAPLPPVVQRCFDSVDSYKGEYQVIRLNDKTIHDYLDLPNYIWNTEGKPKFSRVFFSDLIRLALVHVYGGVWLDATILLTAPLSEKFSSLDYFVFQRSDDEPNKSFWAGPHTSYWSWDPKYRVKMLNSVIFGKKESVMIAAMLDLILHYWKTQNKIVNYFFFQILYHELVNGELKHLQCPIVSDTLPHLMRVLVDGKVDYVSLEELVDTVGIHKLTYFDAPLLENLDKLLQSIEDINVRRGS